VNLRVELGIGEGGIIQLVVTPTPETVQLHEHVLPELLPVLQGKPSGPDHVLRVVAVGVKDWSTDELAQVGTVPEHDEIKRG
jgi:hypothetical protein